MTEKDNFNIQSMEDLKRKWSGEIRKFNNLSAGEKKGQATAYNTKIKMFELALKILKTEFEQNNSENYKELLRQYQELKRVG